jgi:hypothetical protein
MADPSSTPSEVVTPDEVHDDRDHSGEETAEAEGAITEPAKVMRIGSMIRILLEEVRETSLDEGSGVRLAEVYETSIDELASALSPDLQQELHTLTRPFDQEMQDEIPSEAELRVAKAQLVGWLEGLFHGIQASLVAQQVAARQQLQGMRQLPGGGPGQPGEARGPERPGTYL